MWLATKHLHKPHGSCKQHQNPSIEWQTSSILPKVDGRSQLLLPLKLPKKLWRQQTQPLSSSHWQWSTQLLLRSKKWFWLHCLIEWNLWECWARRTSGDPLFCSHFWKQWFHFHHKLCNHEHCHWNWLDTRWHCLHYTGCICINKGKTFLFIV